MTAGPKAAPLHLPLDLEGLPRSGGARVVAFLERYVRPTKGKGARRPLKVRDWQAGLLGGLFADPRPRAALWSMPRGQGNQPWPAGLGLYGLFADRVELALALAELGRLRAQIAAARRREAEARLVDAIDSLAPESTDDVPAEQLVRDALGGILADGGSLRRHRRPRHAPRPAPPAGMATRRSMPWSGSGHSGPGVTGAPSGSGDGLVVFGVFVVTVVVGDDDNGGAGDSAASALGGGAGAGGAGAGGAGAGGAGVDSF